MSCLILYIIYVKMKFLHRPGGVGMLSKARCAGKGVSYVFVLTFPTSLIERVGVSCT